MEYIIGTATTLVSFFLGFFFGSWVKKNVNGDVHPHEQLLPHVKKLVLKSSPVGAVHRPTQQDILDKSDPLSIAQKEEREAMKETLAPIFDT